MNFWQFADAHPFWVTVWIFLLAAAMPSLSYSRKVGVKDEAGKGPKVDQ